LPSKGLTVSFHDDFTRPTSRLDRFTMFVNGTRRRRANEVLTLTSYHLNRSN